MRLYKQPQGLHYGVFLRQEGRLAGYVNVSDGDSHDLGYGFFRQLWRRGLATEACRAVAGQARLAGLPYLTATHDVNNPASGGVMRRLGMAYQYSYEEQWQPKNILATFRLYQLNLNGQHQAYPKYWQQSAVHFVEKGL